MKNNFKPSRRGLIWHELPKIYVYIYIFNTLGLFQKLIYLGFCFIVFMFFNAFLETKKKKEKIIQFFFSLFRKVSQFFRWVPFFSMNSFFFFPKLLEPLNPRSISRMVLWEISRVEKKFSFQLKKKKWLSKIHHSEKI